MEKKTLLVNLLIAIIMQPIFAGPTPSVTKQVGMVPVQFDVVRVETPIRIPNTDNPISSRAYLPSCPPGSNYVSGVNPNLIELDSGPNYSYCNCICKGICNGVAGITSPGGKNPIYTATVTCSATVQGWFDSTIFSKPETNLAATPHRYYYCQSGNCTTHPLPANLNFSVPTGGYTNTTQIDFVSCAFAANNNCGAPDPTSSSRYN
jgi:hypothetical protein